jgi:hypothetical protein
MRGRARLAAPSFARRLRVKAESAFDPSSVSFADTFSHKGRRAAFDYSAANGAPVTSGALAGAASHR